MCALPFVAEDIIPTAWRHLKPLIPSEMSLLSTSTNIPGLDPQNPSIWKFLECLKKEQSLTEVKVRLKTSADNYELQRLLNSHRLSPLY